MLSITGLKDLMRTRSTGKNDGVEILKFLGSGGPDAEGIEPYLAYLAKRLEFDLLCLLEVAVRGKSAKIVACGPDGMTCCLKVPRLDSGGAIEGLIASGETAVGKARVFSKNEVFPTSGDWCDLVPMDSSVAYAFVPLSSLPLPAAETGSMSSSGRTFVLAAADPEASADPAFAFRASIAATLIALSLALKGGRRDRMSLSVLRNILKQECYSIGIVDDKGSLIQKDGSGFDGLAADIFRQLRDDSGPNPLDLSPADGRGPVITAYPLAGSGAGDKYLVAVRECDPGSEARTRRERLKILSRLMSSIAHEIKNPLTGIAAGVQYLARKIQDGLSEDETVEFILSEINRLNRIVDDLYKIARPPELALQEVDLNEVMGRSLICLSDDVTRKRLAVEQNMDGAIPHLEADPDRLQQVFINIIKNAIEASPEGGTLRIDTSRSEAGVTIRVSDHGPGISREDREKIFEPFYSTKERGSGLGLCISQRIVDEHGGSIRVEPAQGGGTSFVIEVPTRR